MKILQRECKRFQRRLIRKRFQMLFVQKTALYVTPTFTSVKASSYDISCREALTYDMYDAADARRAATCWVVDPALSDKYTHRYQDTGVFLEKYVAYKANGDTDGDSDLRFNNNLRIYRYSECLLNAAELVARGAGSGDAAAWLNEVHGRSLAGQTVSMSLDNIKQERRLEFVGEGKRYWDLVRWGDAPTTLVPDSYGYRTNTWSESKKYLPFSQGLMDSVAGKTHELTQNNY